ncbi:hypothetical protein DL96DRAFT_1581695 [Flagelloscypha sp. PMI_526]|nr:hypothetical protein DL96DRAFT_1581695 [Flagelloscypha sp. PMI_526]
MSASCSNEFGHGFSTLPFELVQTVVQLASDADRSPATALALSLVSSGVQRCSDLYLFRNFVLGRQGKLENSTLEFMNAVVHDQSKLTPRLEQAVYHIRLFATCKNLVVKDDYEASLIFTFISKCSNITSLSTFLAFPESFLQIDALPHLQRIMLYDYGDPDEEVHPILLDSLFQSEIGLGEMQHLTHLVMTAAVWGAWHHIPLARIVADVKRGPPTLEIFILILSLAQLSELITRGIDYNRKVVLPVLHPLDDHLTDHRLARVNVLREEGWYSTWAVHDGDGGKKSASFWEQAKRLLNSRKRSK